MKKLLLGCLGVLLFACSPVSNSGTVTTLRIFDYSPDAAAFWVEIIPLFELEYPDIEIVHESVTPDVFFQLKSAKIAGQSVDIISGQPQDDLFTKANRDLFLPLSGEDFLANFYPDLVQQGVVDGEIYLVPTSMETVLVFYNKEIFAEHDLSIPRTWSEFLSCLEVLEAAGHIPILFGGQQQWPVAMHIIALETAIVRSANPDFYSQVRMGESAHNDPEWVEVFEKLSVLKDYYQQFSLGQDYDQIPSLFASGTGAMIIDGSWQAGAITKAQPIFDVGVFALPGTDDVDANGVVSTKMGNGFMVLKDSPNHEAALKFLEFFSRPEIYQLYANATGRLPSQRSAEITDSVLLEILRTINDEKYRQVMVWENLVIPGARYDFDALGIAVVSGDLSGIEAANRMQQNILDTKDDWEEIELP